MKNKPPVENNVPGFLSPFKMSESYECVAHYKLKKVMERQKADLANGKMPVLSDELQIVEESPIEGRSTEASDQTADIVAISPQGLFITAVMGGDVFFKILNFPK